MCVIGRHAPEKRLGSTWSSRDGAVTYILRSNVNEWSFLVCFLAFAMWKTLEGWQGRAGLGKTEP